MDKNVVEKVEEFWYWKVEINTYIYYGSFEACGVAHLILSILSVYKSIIVAAELPRLLNPYQLVQRVLFTGLRLLFISFFALLYPWFLLLEALAFSTSF